MNDQLVSS